MEHSNPLLKNAGGLRFLTFGEINREGYKSVAKQLADKFGFEKVAITLRESHSAFDNGWSAMLYNVAAGEYCFSKK